MRIVVKRSFNCGKAEIAAWYTEEEDKIFEGLGLAQTSYEETLEMKILK
jgi:hypothetical protein